MTIKEIIDGLKFTVDMFLFDPTTGETYKEPRNDMDKTTIDACNGAIELLEQQPRDCISREEVINTLFYKSDNSCDVVLSTDLMDRIKQLPSVIPQRPKGKWITNSHGFPPEPTSVCSECGFDRDFYIRIRGFGKIKYCPNCGAKMEVEEWQI